ncbi:phage tail protein [Salmonella enterica]
MGFHLPNGSVLKVGSELGQAIEVTAVTNAKNAVLTLSGSDVIKGDVVMLKSGWTALDNMVALVTDVSGSDITLGGVDTSNVAIFTAGSGVGSLQVVNKWIEIPQITEVNASGGEQNYYQFQFLSDDQQRSLPTYKSARTQAYTIAHDNSQPFYAVLKAADLASDVTPMSMYVPKAKETRYWAATPSFNGEPNPVVNQIETVTASFAVQSKAMTFYADAE